VGTILSGEEDLSSSMKGELPFKTIGFCIIR
jgi:hypothetical protein